MNIEQLKSHLISGHFKLSESDAERFCKRVLIPTDPSGCWIWQGPVSKRNGYGCFQSCAGRNLRKNHGSHRLVLCSVLDGFADSGLHACHSCDNKVCVNPDHLWAGTNTDNVRDMIQKKRHVYGERSQNSKLTELDVLTIRERYASGERPLHISRDYPQVNMNIIYSVCTGRTWKHLPVTHRPVKEVPVKRQRGLSKGLIDELVDRYINSDVYQKDLALEYGVSPSHVNLILKSRLPAGFQKLGYRGGVHARGWKKNKAMSSL